MTPSSTCPQCGIDATAPARFCSACGTTLCREVPVAVIPPQALICASQPGNATTDTCAPHEQEMRRLARRVERTMLSIAILLTVAGLYVLRNGPGHIPQQRIIAAVVGAFGAAAIFWALYSWSQMQPFAAAMTGAVLFGAMTSVSILTALVRLICGKPSPGVGVGLTDLAVMTFLVRAVMAGLALRKLTQQESAKQTARPSVKTPAPEALKERSPG